MLELSLWWSLEPGSPRYWASEVDVRVPYNERFKAMWCRFVICLLFLTCVAGDAVVAEERAAEGRPVVLQIRLENEAITPITARFIERAIQQAEEERVTCLVILLDTPGGLVDSTRSVAKSILGSDVPVVVYVAPSGARAASAGVFVTLAAHIAAMAPGTNIGAAHPVQIGGLPGSPPSRPVDKKEDSGKISDSPVLDEKIVNDTVAWARTLAELRGRNADWAARAVKESLSASASEAVRERAVDLLADSVGDLLEKIDGREVRVPSGSVRLSTRGAVIRELEMWWGDEVLAVLSNPNLAFLLLIVGFYGILFELNTPGWGVGGTLGVICLALAFLGLAILPINYVGLVLIAVALALFVAEVFFTSFGALTLGGVVCLVLGGVMLVESPSGFQGISLAVLLPVALATAGITFFLVGSIVKAHRSKVETGAEALVGTVAVAQEDFRRDGEEFGGMVRVHGEWWKATSLTPISARQTIEVQERRGLTLVVRARDEDHTPVASERPDSQQETH